MANTLTGMTAQTILHRFFPAMYLVLAALLGCVAGWLATIILGLRLVAPLEKAPVNLPSEQAAVRIRPLSDYQIILDRNIFNPEAAGTTTAVLSEHPAASAAKFRHRLGNTRRQSESGLRSCTQESCP